MCPKDHAVYRSFNGIVLAREEGESIAAALGGMKAAILQNHGLLTTGASVEEAVWWFRDLDDCCRVQLLADAAAAGRGGKTLKVDGEDAAYTWKSVGTSLAGYFQGKPEFDIMSESESESARVRKGPQGLLWPLNVSGSLK